MFQTINRPAVNLGGVLSADWLRHRIFLSE